MTTDPPGPIGAADRLPRARVRCAPVSAATGRSGSQTLAVLLRQLRAERGLGTRRLAERAGVARSTVQRFERGQLRPRPSTLGWIAGALDPDRRAEILGRLVAAAGDHIAADSEAWRQCQTSRMDELLRAGLAPLPVAWERSVRLSAASEAMFRASMTLTDLVAAELGKPAGRSEELMSLDDALRSESKLLGKAAGGLWRATPPPRRRGDPADVSPYPPPLGDLRAVWRWLREWQCREGRLRPRSARERAIAETGTRERQKVRETPGPPVRTAAPRDPHGRDSDQQ